MKRRTEIAVAGAVAVVAVVSGTGAVVAASADGGEGPDTAITGAAKAKAEHAALAAVAGGTVTGTEVDDEESKYEVEVTLDNGGQVDVQLDEDFNVVGQENDGTDDGAGDDSD